MPAQHQPTFALDVKDSQSSSTGFLRAIRRAVSPPPGSLGRRRTGRTEALAGSRRENLQYDSPAMEGGWSETEAKRRKSEVEEFPSNSLRPKCISDSGGRHSLYGSS
jgi:hypothetical protein